MQVSEELQNGFLDEKKRKRVLVNNRGAVLNARQEVQNADIRLERLRNAKESGYFEANITIISEPATAESIARRIKFEAPKDETYAELSINRVPPQLLTRTIRRYPLLSSDRLTGEEVASLVQLPTDLSDRRIKNVVPEPTKLRIAQLPVDIPLSPTKP
jgi:hypothetical protein